MIPAVLRCANCGAPLTVRAPHCAYCHAPQHWDDRLLDVHRGELVERIDCTRDPVTLREHESDCITNERVPPSPRGIERSWEAASGSIGLVRRAMRDAAVVVEGEGTDAGGFFGALLRMQELGASTFAYAFAVCPGRRAFVVRKLLARLEQAHEKDLVPWQIHPAIRGVGERNRVELRAADALLVALVNDVPVARVESADLGFGNVGWYMGAAPMRPGSARVWSVEVYRAG